MTTYTHIASSPRFGHLRAHLRTYLAGVGATTALIAGALVAFLSVSTFVAFKGLPFAGPSNDAGAAYLGSDASAATAPAAAAAALAAAHAAVTKDPVPGSHGGGSGSGGGSGGSNQSGGGNNAPGGGPSGGGDPPTGGPTDPGAPGAPGDPIVDPPLPSSSAGPVTNAVQGVDNAAGTNVSGPTSGVTGAVDGAATGALNQAGGAAGHPHLGDQVGGAVKGATDTVLGGGGGGGLLGG